MYFAHLSRTNSPANALQKQAITLLTDRSNRLVHDKGTYLAKFREDIDNLNAKNPRCQPLVLSTYGILDDQIGIALGSHFTIRFYLYKVKEASNA